MKDAKFIIGDIVIHKSQKSNPESAIKLYVQGIGHIMYRNYILNIYDVRYKEPMINIAFHGQILPEEDLMLLPETE